MQLSASLFTLLTGVLFMLSMQAVEAVPVTRRTHSLVTLPLKRVEQTKNIHGQIYLQQHVNRAIRRLAIITGSEAPTASELQEKLERRVFAIEGADGLRRRFKRHVLEYSVLEKRYNRHGVPKGVSRHPSSSESLVAISAKKKGGKNGNGNGGNGAGNQTQPQGPVSGVELGNTPTFDDSLALDIEAQDVGYLATIQMGTPPRDFLILMDSGSADLWVGAEGCTSQGGGDCGTHNFLGPQSSSSFVDTQKPFSVTYGTGQVSGDIITDNISVAGLNLPAHTFGVAKVESVDFSSNDTPFDGLMGLAKSALSEQQTLTPPESLAKAGLIQDAIVSFKISREADNKNDGEITFGNLDPSKFDPNTKVTVDNVNQDGFWEAAVDAATVNGVDTGLQDRTAILDTGTTLIVVPPADATTLHQNIQGAKSDGQGGFTVPCNLQDSVAFTFGGQQFAIDPRDIAFQPVDPNNPNGDCVSGITSGEVGGPDEWLVGDVFLKNAYFSTDVGQNKITLAKLV